MAAGLDFTHVYEPAADAGRPTLLMLHGTGGNEHDLVPAGHVDRQGNVWVTDNANLGGKGQQVLKFSPDGKLLMASTEPTRVAATRRWRLSTCGRSSRTIERHRDDPIVAGTTRGASRRLLAS